MMSRRNPRYKEKKFPKGFFHPEKKAHRVPREKYRIQMYPLMHTNGREKESSFFSFLSFQD
jgi:hypothetical protein